MASTSDYESNDPGMPGSISGWGHFLARLWWAIAMTWRSSVTARAISMKLGVRIPLRNTPRAFFDYRDLTYFVASRRPSWKSAHWHLVPLDDTGTNNILTQYFIFGMTGRVDFESALGKIYHCAPHNSAGYRHSDMPDHTYQFPANDVTYSCYYGRQSGAMRPIWEKCSEKCPN
jgi:hypothetical protein